MKRTIVIILTVALLAVTVFTGTVSADSETTPSVWSGEVAASYEGGSGTKDDPYQIATAEQLAMLVNSSSDGKYYKLTKDIYLNDVSSDNWTKTAKSWYDSQQKFMGSFDGDGHTIYGLYYNGSYGFFGLFCLVQSNTMPVEIKNLRLANADITTSGDYIGGIAGLIYNNGYSYTFANCVIEDTVSVTSTKASGYAGGLIGYSRKVTNIEGCASFATVTGKYAGGFVGYKGETLNLSDSFTTSNYFVGSGSANTSSAIYSKIDPSTIMGDDALTAMPDLGWDSTWFTAEGAYPENIAFHKVSLETPWNGTVAKNYAGGSGTKDDPYQIATAEQMALLSSTATGGTTGRYYKLTSDIYLNDVSADNWTESAKSWYGSDNRFEGHFDGNGHTVYGLYYSGSAISGLFPRATTYSNDVSVSNLKISEAYISTSSSYVGAIMGFVYGKSTHALNFENCVIDDSVTVISTANGAYAGGLVGYAQQHSAGVNVTSSFSSASITAKYAGAFFGIADSSTLKVTDSFATTKMQGSGNTTLESSYENVSANDIKGSAAKTVMPALSWNTVWVPAEGLVPQNGAFYVGDYASGAGTATDPYILSDAYHLYRAIYIDRGANTDGNKAYYKLVSDLYLNTDESAVNWYNAKAEKNGFIGSIEGDGFTVYGLIYGDDASVCGGLIPLATKTAEVKNLRVEGADVNTERGGAIIGWANDDVIVSGCSVSGATVTADWAGAIVGLASAGDNIVIKDSYAVDSALTSTSISSPYAPALYGDAYGVTLKLENCYIEGYYVKPIKADGGVRAGTVTNCYFTATEDTVLPATDTSGIEIKDGNWSVISGFSSDIWYQAGSKAPLLKVRGLRLMDVSGDDNSVIDADDFSALRLYIIGDAAYKNIIGDTDNNGAIDVCDLVKLYL